MKKCLVFLVLTVLANHSYAENCKVNDADIAREYSGECKDGFAHGTGRAQGKDSYIGQFINGNKSGKGVFTWPSGSRYEGYFVDDKESGKGVYTFSDGDRYEGDFLNGDPTGKGVFTYLSGNRYEGDVVKGALIGKGVFTWANRDRYEGDFVNNGERTGKGVFTSPNGDRYEGDFVDGKRTGKGVFTWPNGDRYEGDFVDGKRTGKGVYTWANRDRYEGGWKNGEASGYGWRFESKINKTYEGLWENGNLLKSCPRIECDPNYNPYEGLDKKTVRDIVMSKITTALKDSRYNDAIPHFNYLENNDSDLPESFYFYQINTLYNAGNKAVAASKAQAYLKKYSSNSKYYAEVIEIMGKL